MNLTINSENAKQTTCVDNMKKMISRSEADEIITQSKNGDEIAVAYNAMNIGENQYTTQFGTSVESKYGYAAEFDSVSRDYAKEMIKHNYTAASTENVVSDMENKYQSLKSEIEEKYSGNEKEERLSELDCTYNFIMKANVIDSTDLVLKNESAVNKLRMTFAQAYENAKQTKSSEFVQTAYGSMENWLEICNDINKQINSYKEMFEKFKESMEDIHKEPGASDYANSLLKSIVAGLSGVEEKKTELGQNVNTSSNETVKEIWELIEEKSQTVFTNKEVGTTNSEKYQLFLKNAKQAEVIDQKLNDMLSELLED